MTLLNWHNLPPDLRVGKTPDDLVTVYRGFSPDQLDPEKGMLSTAAASEDTACIDQVVQAVEKGDKAGIKHLMDTIAAHTSDGHAKRTGIVTPYVSAAFKRSHAEWYATQPGEKIATIKVRADQLVGTPLFKYEVLILGSVSVEQIVSIEDGPGRAEPEQELQSSSPVATTTGPWGSFVDKQPTIHHPELYAA